MALDMMQAAAESQAHAGWLQAIGALIALVVTIWLNRSDANDRRIERDARARSAGIVILPILNGFRAELFLALKKIDRGENLSEVGPADEDGQSYGLAGIWTPPPKLDGMLASLAELGPAAKASQNAYRSMEVLKKAFLKHYMEEIDECLYDDPAINESSIEETRKCLIAVDLARTEIERLFE